MGTEKIKYDLCAKKWENKLGYTRMLTYCNVIVPMVSVKISSKTNTHYNFIYWSTNSKQFLFFVMPILYKIVVNIITLTPVIISCRNLENLKENN